MWFRTICTFQNFDLVLSSSFREVHTVEICWVYYRWNIVWGFGSYCSNYLLIHYVKRKWRYLLNRPKISLNSLWTSSSHFIITIVWLPKNHHLIFSSRNFNSFQNQEFWKADSRKTDPYNFACAPPVLSLSKTPGETRKKRDQSLSCVGVSIACLA